MSNSRPGGGGGKIHGRGNYFGSQRSQDGPHMRNQGTQGRCWDSNTRNQNQPVMTHEFQSRNHGSVLGHENMRNSMWSNPTSSGPQWGSLSVDPWIRQPNSRPALLPTPDHHLIQEPPNLHNMRELLGLNGSAAPNIPGQGVSQNALLQAAISMQGQQYLQVLANSYCGQALNQGNANPGLNLAQLNSESQVNMLLRNLNSVANVSRVSGKLVNQLINQQPNNRSIIQQSNNQPIIQQPLQRNSVQSKFGLDRGQSEDDQTSGGSNPESKLEGCAASARSGRNHNQRRPRRKIRRSDKILGGVPSHRLYCHICKKPFEGSKTLIDHLGGRPHQEKLRETESKYIMEQKELRQSAKLKEQKKQFSFKNAGGEVRLEQLHLCDVCDLHFIGERDDHERLDTHKALLKYHKKRCHRCSQNFPTRVKYEEHISSIEHIKCVGMPDYQARKQATAIKKEEAKEISDNNGREEERKTESEIKEEVAAASEERCSSEEEKAREEKDDAAVEKDAAAVEKDDAAVEKDDAVVEKENEAEDKENAPEEKKVEAKMKLLDSPANQTDTTWSLPPSIADGNPTTQPLETHNHNPQLGKKRKLQKELLPYDPNVRVGEDYLTPKQGWMCTLCASFLPSEKTVHAHFTSKAHYENYAQRVRKSKGKTAKQRRNSERASRKTSIEVEDTTMETEDSVTTLREENDSLSKSAFEQYLETKDQLSSTRPLTRIPVVDLDGDDDDAPEVDGNWKRQRVSSREYSEPSQYASLASTASSSCETSNYETLAQIKTTVGAALLNDVSEDVDYIVGSVDEDLLNM